MKNFFQFPYPRPIDSIFLMLQGGDMDWFKTAYRGEEMECIA